MKKQFTPLLHRIVTLLTVFLLVFFSCKKDMQQTDGFISLQEQTPANAIIQLQKLKNPYSVSNMLQAYAAIKTNGNIEKAKQVSQIKPTHFYIKFTPADDKEAGLLKRDSTLNLYTYPLDAAIPDKFDVTAYHRQQETAGVKEVYYASVPVGHSLPKMRFEILEQLFIPDDYSDNNANARAAANAVSDVGVAALVAKSFELTGNKQESTGNNTIARAVTASWRPAGRIRAWDKTVAAYVPVEGLKVRAKRWFTTYTGFTNVSGVYTCDGTFDRAADYSFDWERYEFAIRDGDFSTAGEAASNIKGDWSPDYDATTISIYHAAIFRAAFHYAYKDIQGLRRPPANGTLQTQLKYRAFPGADPDLNGEFNPARRFLGLGSAIHIYDKDRQTDRIYGTVIHETAHASHWNMVGASNWSTIDDIVAESWASGVQWALTRMVYPNFQNFYNRLKYTGIVEDMIDGVGEQISQYYYTYSNPWVTLDRVIHDNVEGYTIRQIEDALNGQVNWSQWQINMTQMYSNPTSSNLPLLFYEWNLQ